MTLSFSEKWAERMGELAGQPKGLITEWQDYTIYNRFINYKSYCMGAR